MPCGDRPPPAVLSSHKHMNSLVLACQLRSTIASYAGPPSAPRSRDTSWKRTYSRLSTQLAATSWIVRLPPSLPVIVHRPTRRFVRAAAEAAGSACDCRTATTDNRDSTTAAIFMGDYGLFVVRDSDLIGAVADAPIGGIKVPSGAARGHRG